MDLSAHKSAVNAVCFTPDGLSLCSGGDDGAIRTWWIPKVDKAIEEQTLATYTEVESTMSGHGAPVVAISAGADSATIVSASQDNTMKLWLIDTYEGQIEHCFSTIPGHKTTLTAAAFSGDGRRIASTGDTMSVHVYWSQNKGTHMSNYNGHAAKLSAVAWNPTALSLVTGDEEGRLIMWENELYDEIAELTQHKKTSVATYNDDSSKNIIQSFQKHHKLPTDQ